MAAEISTAPAAEAEAEAPAKVGAPHKLERKWTFWFDNQSKPKQGAAWGTSLRKAYTFDSVEEFWWYGQTNTLIDRFLFSRTLILLFLCCFSCLCFWVLCGIL